MNYGNDMLVMLSKDLEYQIITHVVWYKNEFAGIMSDCIIYGVVDKENISVSYLLPEGKVNLMGVVIEYGNFSNII